MKSSQFRFPDARECAILLLLLATHRDNPSKGSTRFRLSELTLKRLWQRNRITDEFLKEVQEWLARADWTIFYAAGVYAIVRIEAVQNWDRLSSKRLTNELKQVGNGTFDYERHAHLIVGDQDDNDD
ncbi:hypothetical protein [Bradyrhizobium sp. WSM4349]|uniref:hypothetical protein n=1 Tax=Bradyrhizobium sp. WSM4349 TaxID=1040988 RepID=UPI000584A55C|nr:hypothetical protein [Bradyrhizobium sp. WSM4349]